MFSFIKSLFRRSKPAAAGATPSSSDTASAPGVNRQAEATPAMPRVETAQLSLMAVMSRFPDDLRKLVLKMPPPEAMVVLPLPTIQKMLPTGSVKMSLASVVRQAPPGTFATINPQDKRLVEVPLAEIFKRISPALLKKRPDQKQSELAAEGFDIFGDDENPHTLAPKVEGVAQAANAAAAPTLGVPPGKVLKVPPGVVTAPPANMPLPATASGNAAAPAAPLPKPKPLGKPAAAPAPAAPAPVSAPAAPAPVAPPAPAKIAAKVPAPAAPEKTTPPKKAAAPAAPAVASDQPPLVISLGEILGSWPEPIKSEATALNGSTVSLPAGDVASGLQRGKIVFSWGQLRSWMSPAPGNPSQAADSTELILPLRVIAPAFMKHTKGAGTARKAGEVGDIPELFAGRNKPAAKAPAPEPEAPAPEPEKAPEPEAKAPEPAVEAKAPEPAPEPEAKTPEPQPEAKAPEPEPTPEPAPAPAAEVEAPAPAPEVEAPAAAPEAPAAKEEPVVTEPEAPAPAPEAKAEPPSEPEAKPEPEAVPAPAPVVEPAAAASAPAAVPQSLGELFGEPDKSTWSPTEIVNRLSELPDVAGACVALQEGLVIAHKLPEPLKGEIFAAFLPQLFARMNQYAGEMKLGGVNEVTLQTEVGPCYLFRRGQVFFAALGKPDATLPTHNLRLCADAVAS